MNRDLLLRAAAIIDREAEGIRATHTLLHHGAKGKWNLHDDEHLAAKRQHDEMVRVARELREAA